MKFLETFHENNVSFVKRDLTKLVAQSNNRIIMQKRSSIKRNRSKDENVMAKSVIDEIIELTESETFQHTPDKNSAAVMLGRLGGLKGGKARANKLSAEERSEIARNAAIARWKKDKE